MNIKSIRVESYGGPEVLRLENVSIPEPGTGEVIVRLKAAGVNPVDTYQREASRGYKPQLPFTPGLDGAGTVDAVGPGVTRVQTGDRVYLAGSITGTYAEAALCREDQLYPIPEGIDFIQAAALFVNYFTAFRALFQRGGLQPDDKVLVHGASGGVGIAALQALAWRGTAAAATAGSEEGLSLASAQGAAFTADHRNDQHWQQVRNWSGNGFDLILEMSAADNLTGDLQLLSTGGRIVIIGSRGSIDLDPRLLMRADADIRGMVMMNAEQSELEELAGMIADAASSGFIKPVIRKFFDLNDAADAHRLVRQPGAAGKIVLQIT